MDAVLLGTAAGGGFPQWNCWCPTCRVARTNPARAHPRTQSSLAVSADGARWFLFNASPDVREQLRHLDGHAPQTLRHVPVEGIVPTDAELDHTLGIALLREGRRLALYTTPAVLEVLNHDSRIVPVTYAFARVAEIPLEPGRPHELAYLDGSPSGLEVTPFIVPGDPPRFARRDLPGHTVGYQVRDLKGGGVLAFAPGCGALDPAILQRLGAADLVLFDGTFWSDDEMVRLGLSDRTARQMDHLPVGGEDGSLAVLKGLPSARKVFTHINNSNPMLIEDSPERRAVTDAGWQVGDDGMRFRL